MKITMRQLKQLIREQVEETRRKMSSPGADRAQKEYLDSLNSTERWRDWIAAGAPVDGPGWSARSDRPAGHAEPPQEPHEEWESADRTIEKFLNNGGTALARLAKINPNKYKTLKAPLLGLVRSIGDRLRWWDDDGGKSRNNVVDVANLRLPRGDGFVVLFRDGDDREYVFDELMEELMEDYKDL